jgi:tetratricopeptide (TPR) repeat protein
LASAFSTFEMDAENAVRFGLEALELRRSLDDNDGVADALRWLGEARALAGETDEARRLFTESIALRERVGDTPRLARTLVALAHIEQEDGNAEAAVELLHRSLKLARADNADGLVGDTLHSLGDVSLIEGDAAKAVRFYLDAMSAVSDADEIHTVYCLAGLASAAALEHQVARAGRLWGAVESYQLRADVQLDPSVTRRYTTALTIVHGSAFAAAVTGGRGLTLDQAVEEARQPETP